MTDPFDDNEILRALRAPGNADELGAEDDYRALFHSARESGEAGTVVELASHRRTSKLARRFGAGTTLVVALAAAGGGAAAAYTGNLPDPIQSLAHHALGPVGPPAPAPHLHRAAPPATRTPTPTPSPATSPSPSPTPTSSPSPSRDPGHATPSGRPTPSASGSTSASATPTPTPTSLPSATPTPTPTPTPTSTPTSPPPAASVPASVSIAGTTHRVEVGQTVSFSGVVTADDGSPVRHHVVTLQERSGSGWVRISSARSDRSGGVSLTLPPAGTTVGVRLRAGRVHSTPWRVRLTPALTVTSAPGPSKGTAVITVDVVGGQPGDVLRLLSRGSPVASATLGSDGSATFQVTPDRRHTRYSVLLPKTRSHDVGHGAIVVVVRTPKSSPAAQ